MLKAPDQDWELFVPMPGFSPIKGASVVMRRRKDGSWEYRTLTAEEESEYVKNEAW